MVMRPQPEGLRRKKDKMPEDDRPPVLVMLLKLITDIKQGGQRDPQQQYENINSASLGWININHSLGRFILSVLTLFSEQTKYQLN